MTAATDCHETVIVVTLNIRARFERLIQQPWLFGRARAVFGSSWAPVLHCTVMFETFRADDLVIYLSVEVVPSTHGTHEADTPGAPTLPPGLLVETWLWHSGLIDHNKLALAVSSYASRAHCPGQTGIGRAANFREGDASDAKE